MDQCDTDDYLINKETLYPGTKYIPFVDGTRVGLSIDSNILV